MPLFCYRHGEFYYYTKTLEGQQYKIHCRRRIPVGAGAASETETMDESSAEEILLCVLSLIA